MGGGYLVNALYGNEIVPLPLLPVFVNDWWIFKLGFGIYNTTMYHCKTTTFDFDTFLAG